MKYSKFASLSKAAVGGALVKSTAKPVAKAVVDAVPTGVVKPKVKVPAHAGTLKVPVGAAVNTAANLLDAAKAQKGGLGDLVQGSQPPVKSSPSIFDGTVARSDAFWNATAGSDGLLWDPPELSLRYSKDPKAFDAAVVSYSNGDLSADDFTSALMRGLSEDYEESLAKATTDQERKTMQNAYYRYMQNLCNLERLKGRFKVRAASKEDISALGNDETPYVVSAKAGDLVKYCLFDNPANYDRWMQLRRKRISGLYNKLTDTYEAPDGTRLKVPDSLPDFYAYDAPVTFALMPANTGLLGNKASTRGFHRPPKFSSSVIMENDGAYRDGGLVMDADQAYSDYYGYGQNYLHCPVNPDDPFSFNRVFTEESLHALLGKLYALDRGWDGYPLGLRMGIPAEYQAYESIIDNPGNSMAVPPAMLQGMDNMTVPTVFGGDKATNSPVGRDKPFSRYVYRDAEYMRAKAMLSIAFMNAGYSPDVVMRMTPDMMRNEFRRRDSMINAYIGTHKASDIFGKRFKAGPQNDTLNDIPVIEASREDDAYSVLNVDQDYNHRIGKLVEGSDAREQAHRVSAINDRLDGVSQETTAEHHKAIDGHFNRLLDILRSDKGKYDSLWWMEGLFPPMLLPYMNREDEGK